MIVGFDFKFGFKQQGTTELLKQWCDNHSIEFSTRKNKEKDLTEYYNLIYQYKNDCLTAAVEYKKDYYSDGDLKPEEQLFFSITIVPFGKTNTPSLSKWLTIK